MFARKKPQLTASKHCAPRHVLSLRDGHGVTGSVAAAIAASERAEMMSPALSMPTPPSSAVITVLRVDSSPSSSRPARHVSSPSTASPGAASMDAAVVEVPVASPSMSRAVVAVLCVGLGSDALSLTVLLPFVGLLVGRFSSLAAEQVGMVSGLLVGMFNLAMAAASRPCGRIGDRYGRRPVLLTALFSSTAVMLLFGLAGSVWTLLAVRALHGLIGTTAVTVKAAVPEVASAGDEAWLWSALTFASTFGSASGPMIGGLLYNPVGYAPELLSGTIFDSRPALLPCMVAAACSAVTFIIAVFTFPEPNPNAKPLPSWVPAVLVRYVFDDPTKSHNSHRDSPDLGSDNDANDAEEMRLVPMAAGGAVESGGAGLRHRGGADAANLRDPAPSHSEASPGPAHQHPLFTDTDATPRAPGAEPKDDPVASASPLAPETPEAAGQPPAESAPPATAQASFTYGDVWRHPVLRRLAITSALSGAAHMIFVETLPLLCIAPAARDGFGMDSHHIGLLFAAQAVLVAVSNAAFPAVSRRFDRARLIVVNLAVYGLTLLAIPLVATLSKAGGGWSEAQVIAALVALSVVRAPSMCFFVGTLLMGISAASPAAVVGQVTGITHSVNALARAVAPILGTPLFAWSISADPPRAFPFNHWCIFVVAFVLNVGGIAAAVGIQSAAITRATSAAAVAAAPPVEAHTADDEVEGALPSRPSRP